MVDRTAGVGQGVAGNNDWDRRQKTNSQYYTPKELKAAGVDKEKTTGQKVGKAVAGVAEGAGNIAREIMSNITFGGSGKGSQFNSAHGRAMQQGYQETAQQKRKTADKTDKNRAYFEGIKGKDEHTVAAEDSEASAKAAQTLAEKTLSTDAGSGAAALTGMEAAEQARQAAYHPALQTARDRRDIGANKAHSLMTEADQYRLSSTGDKINANLQDINARLGSSMLRDEEVAKQVANQANTRAILSPNGTDSPEQAEVEEEKPAETPPDQRLGQDENPDDSAHQTATETGTPQSLPSENPPAKTPEQNKDDVKKMITLLAQGENGRRVSSERLNQEMVSLGVPENVREAIQRATASGKPRAKWLNDLIPILVDSGYLPKGTSPDEFGYQAIPSTLPSK